MKSAAQPSRLRFWRRRPKVVYGCGNCRKTFKTEEAMRAHQPCPLVVLEREVAEWNAEAHRLIAYREAEFDV